MRCAAALPDQSEKELMTSVEILDEFMGMSVCDSGELTSVSRDYAMRRFHRVDGTGKTHAGMVKWACSLGIGAM